MELFATACFNGHFGDLLMEPNDLYWWNFLPLLVLIFFVLISRIYWWNPMTCTDGTLHLTVGLHNVVEMGKEKKEEEEDKPDHSFWQHRADLFSSEFQHFQLQAGWFKEF